MCGYSQCDGVLESSMYRDEKLVERSRQSSGSAVEGRVGPGGGRSSRDAGHPRNIGTEKDAADTSRRRHTLQQQKKIQEREEWVLDELG